MQHVAKTLAGIALGYCMTGNAAQAASIQSMTIEEIGVANSGMGTSALAGGGGFGDLIPASGSYTPSPAFFISAGSSTGAIVMGTTQGNGEFTLGTDWGGQRVLLNTLHGAPSGSITYGIFMALDLSGWYADLPSVDLTFNSAPDAGSLLLSAFAIDTTHYYYTADWTHVIVDGDVHQLSSGIAASGWSGSTILMHLEGVATLAPVPEADTYTMMLAGLGLVGLMARRRRKMV